MSYSSQEVDTIVKRAIADRDAKIERLLNNLPKIISGLRADAMIIEAETYLSLAGRLRNYADTLHAMLEDTK